MAEKFANAFSTTLTAAIDTVATSIAVATAAPAALQGGEFRILVGGGELMLVTATGSSGASPWTVQRAAEVPSVAMSHASGATAEHVLTAASLSEAVGSGSAPRIVGALGTNLGAAQTITFTGAEEVWLLGVANNASLVVTLAAPRVTGARCRVIAVHDGTSSPRAISFSDGTTPQQVVTSSVASELMVADADCPNATDLTVFNPGGGTGPAGPPGADGAGAADASTTVKGIAKVTPAPASPTDPIALGANAIDTDGTLAANSATKVPSQSAVKTYADQLIAAADVMVFKGVIDCSANPNYPAADRGHTYRVSVAGKIGGASGTNVEAGDLALCLTDGTAAGTQAAVGSAWTITQTNLDGAVIGPASATDLRVAVFSGTTGKLIADGGTLLSALALLVSPTFTGNPAAPTQSAGDNSTKLATTAYADALKAAVATLTNKRITQRVTAITSSATPAVNTDDCDCVTITALAAAITSMTSSLTGTPNNFDTLVYRIKDNGTARAITWGASFEPKGVALPTTTVISKVLTVGFVYDTVAAKWGCVSSAQEA